MNSLTPSLTTMISLPNKTKSPISQTLTDEQREYLIDLVASRYLDCMDVRDLERFFHDTQREYMQEYTDAELLGAIEDITDDDEFNEVLNEIG
jgi:hypothetical protein